MADGRVLEAVLRDNMPDSRCLSLLINWQLLKIIPFAAHSTTLHGRQPSQCAWSFRCVISTTWMLSIKLKRNCLQIICDKYKTLRLKQLLNIKTLSNVNMLENISFQV